MNYDFIKGVNEVVNNTSLINKNGYKIIFTKQLNGKEVIDYKYSKNKNKAIFKELENILEDNKVYTMKVVLNDYVKGNKVHKNKPTLIIYEKELGNA